MKNLFHDKVLRTCTIVLLAVIVILLAFRVPTRISAARFNELTTLPVGLLESGVDWSEYSCLGGFGMTVFRREGETGLLEYSYSNWPDAIFGKQKVDYIVCQDSSMSICGFSVGDDITQADELLRQYGFTPTRNNNQYNRFGVILTLHTERNSTKINGIVIAVGSTNILGVVY